MHDVADLSLALFESHIGDTFQVCDPHYREDLTLIEAHAMTDASGMGRKAGCFTLVFAGSNLHEVMQQGIRHFRHELLGEFDMAITPNARLPEGTIRYSAIFH